MKITMKEVAQKAGVSTATVSHVINDSRYVRPDTKERVLAAISEMNFYPNVAARIFKTGKKNTIGFIVPDLSSSFFASIIEEIEKLLAKKNYKLLIVNTQEQPKRELESIRLLCAGLVDGIIIASPISDFNQIKKELLKNNQTPFVFLEKDITDLPYDSIMISDHNATIACMENLLADGHRRIGFITGTAYLSSSKERLDAYTRALEEHGLPVLSELIQNGDNHALCAIENLIAQGCTAIIASTINITYDAILYFFNNHISVSDQIALVGYVNDDYISTNLTNMYQVIHPIQEMGAIAVEQLFRRINQPDAPIKNIVLMGRFVKPRSGQDLFEKSIFNACF